MKRLIQSVQNYVRLLGLVFFALATVGCSGVTPPGLTLSCEEDSECLCDLNASDKSDCHWFGGELSQNILAVTNEVQQTWGCYADAAGGTDADAAPCCYMQTCDADSGECGLTTRGDGAGNVLDSRCARAGGAGTPRTECGPLVGDAGDLMYFCLGSAPSPPECFYPEPVEVLGGNFIYVPDPAMFQIADTAPSECRTLCSMEGADVGALVDCPLDELALSIANLESLMSADIPATCKVTGLEKATEIDVKFSRTTACEDGNSCTLDVCDAATNKCVSTALANGTACDEDPNLVDEKCMESVCTHAPCDDGNPCTYDTLGLDGCVYTSAPGTPCGGGNGVCNGSGVCQNDTSDCPVMCETNADCLGCQGDNACLGQVECIAGSCEVNPQTVVVCPSHPSPCASQTCEPSTGECVYIAAGTSCSDQNSCTSGEVCDGEGHCVSDGFENIPCVTDADCSECVSADSCTGPATCSDNGTCELPPPLEEPVTDGCMQYVCDSDTGNMGWVPVQNGTSCNDNSACTVFDVCLSGQCVGSDVDCVDGIACTLDECDPETGCTNELSDEACDDDNPCTFDECNFASLGCVYENSTLPCDDNDACTTGDQCDGGGCFGIDTSVVDCDDGNVCTDDFCEPAIGCNSVNNSVACNDGNACTTEDMCGEGACNGVDTSAVDCDDDNICTFDSCDADQGCIYELSTLPCDDGNACTTQDVCADGSCIGGDTSALDCDDDNVCTFDTCDPIQGCTYELSTLPCDDGNACTTDDVCAEESCVGVDTSGLDCDDGNVCTFDTCDPIEGCAYELSTLPCDDDNACTTDDVCAEGSCAGVDTSVADCDDNNVCTFDTCDPELGCQTEDSTLFCEDGDACTTDDVCADGVCGGVDTSVADCDDGNVCTDDSCDVETGCVNTDNVVECDDGNACTTGDVCAESVCAGVDSSGLDCDDDDVCTLDLCDPDTGCSYEFSTLPCDDGNACTTDDVCADGVCAGADSSVVDCDDGNVCTDDSCNVETGCVNTENTVDCDDGNACTTGDVCADGACGGVDTSATDCDDGNVCTDDSCDVATGCSNSNNTEVCDDGNACTTGDVCAESVCAGADSSVVDCDDGNVCTDDSCDAATGCVNAENTEACDDDNVCTTSDVCVGGSCIGTDTSATDCDDGNVCTDDSCDVATGCSNTNSTEACDDGDACIIIGACAEGICVAEEAVNCDDGNVCTDDSCDAATGCVNADNAAACDDGDICTLDTCDPALGCVYAVDGLCYGGDEGDPCDDDANCQEEFACVDESLAAIASDAMDLSGYQALADPSTAFILTLPTSAGGSGTGIGIQFDIGATTEPPSVGEDWITIATAGSDDVMNAERLIKAINGEADETITYGNAEGEGSLGIGIQGITAFQGSSDTTVTLAMNTPGAAGNIPDAIVQVAGIVDFVMNASFSGGADELSFCSDGTEEDPCNEEVDCQADLNCSGLDVAAATATILIEDPSVVGEGDTITLVATDGSSVVCTITDPVAGSQTEAPTSEDVTAKSVQMGNYANATLAATALAVNIRTAIDFHEKFTATNNGSLITITQAIEGSAGNGEVVLDELFATGLSKSNFTGGSNALGTCTYPMDCVDILLEDMTAVDGVYGIDPDGLGEGASFDVWCDMTTDNGGWTLAAISSDDGQDTWTWTNRHYWDTDPTTFGDLDNLNQDFKSTALHSVLMGDVLFVHAPSGVWGSYHDIGDELSGMASFIENFGGEMCWDPGMGYPLTAGTLTASESLCDTQLYFNAQDKDGGSSCNEEDHSYGPTWNAASPIGTAQSCPFDDPGVSGSLGPAAVKEDPAVTFEEEYGGFVAAVGFGNALGLNSGGAGTGQNNMRVYVRRSFCGDGVQDPGEECDDGNFVNADGCSNTCTENNFLLDCNGDHCCALNSDALAVCWGRNNLGQTNAPSDAFESIAVGWDHTCALKSDGSASCWGGNQWGQSNPPAGAFEVLVLGWKHTCGLKSDGSVECWGDNNFGQCSPPQEVFASISAGDTHTCGLKNDGSVLCWGKDDDGQTSLPEGTLTMVTTGDYHTCGLKIDGSVICWGDNSYGQSVPPETTFETISTGWHHNCGLKSDGSVECWGGNENGQSNPPEGVFEAIFTAWQHTCGLKSDGSVECWGWDEYGQSSPPVGLTL